MPMVTTTENWKLITGNLPHAASPLSQDDLQNLPLKVVIGDTTGTKSLAQILYSFNHIIS